MAIGLGRIGQIALAVDDVDAAESFYGGVLGLRKLYRFGDLTFFDCGGVRLLLEKAHGAAPAGAASVIYFAVPDIALGVRALQQRGVAFSLGPHLVAPMEDHDLWMAFFADPDGHTLALMHEAPKGYAPAAG
jgi:methylmalonyl-CoA/ethylmalonyl-CoA epimerase